MNQRDIEIIPAILESRVENVIEKLERIKGKVERVSIDIIDGVYADNMTVALEDLRDVDFGNLAIDVQLMTEYPSEFLGECKNIGAERVFGHIERMGSQSEFVETAKELGIKPALGLDLFTPIGSIKKGILDELDGVLLMSVKAGFSGQKFDVRAIEKIKKLRAVGFEGDIQMDGGMNPETVAACYNAGANQFGVTSYLWKSGDIDRTFDELVSLIKD